MKRILFILCIALLAQTLHAQKETNIWFFGNYAGLDFNNLDGTVLANECWWDTSTNAWAYNYNVNATDVPIVIPGHVSTMEGCFTLSDQNGQLMMSSDGITVKNKDGVAMNTVSLGGNPSATQSGIVIPKPGDPSSFYIVSVAHERRGPIQYAEVDMTMNGNLGGMVSQNNILTVGNADENIAAIPHENGVDYWLINRTANDYQVWLVTNTGFVDQGITPAGSSALGMYDFIGELIISPDGTRIVSLTFDRGEILSADFNTTTGQITNTNVRDAGVIYNTGLYGGCFSPNGDYLYFTRTNLSAYVYESYLVSWSDLRTGGAFKYITPVSNIHRGSDDRLYGIRRDSQMLLIMENPDQGDLVTKYIPTYFSAAYLPQAGLPTFLSSYLKSDITMYPLACNKNPRDISVEVTVGGTSPATTMDWDFGDGTSLMGQPLTLGTHTYTQSHTYNTPGLKTITITPKTAIGVAQQDIVLTINVIPCAIKTNRMIRADLKNPGEP